MYFFWVQIVKIAFGSIHFGISVVESFCEQMTHSQHSIVASIPGLASPHKRHHRLLCLPPVVVFLLYLQAPLATGFGLHPAVHNMGCGLVTGCAKAAERMAPSPAVVRSFRRVPWLRMAASDESASAAGDGKKQVPQKQSQEIHAHTYAHMSGTHMHTHMHTHTHIGTANPTWGEIFECCFKAQSSKLECLFCYISVNRDVRALCFELWKSIPKFHLAWVWLYVGSIHNVYRKRR